MEIRVLHVLKKSSGDFNADNLQQNFRHEVIFPNHMFSGCWQGAQIGLKGCKFRTIGVGKTNVKDVEFA